MFPLASQKLDMDFASHSRSESPVHSAVPIKRAYIIDRNLALHMHQNSKNNHVLYCFFLIDVLYIVEQLGRKFSMQRAPPLLDPPLKCSRPVYERRSVAKKTVRPDCKSREADTDQKTILICAAIWKEHA